MYVSRILYFCNLQNNYNRYRDIGSNSYEIVIDNSIYLSDGPDQQLPPPKHSGPSLKLKLNKIITTAFAKGGGIILFIYLATINIWQRVAVPDLSHIIRFFFIFTVSAGHITGVNGLSIAKVA